MRVFAPEHGLRGQAGAGEKVADGSDPRTGLPVVSLYGRKQAPVRRGPRAASTRWSSTCRTRASASTPTAARCLLCLEAAGEAGLELVVLDRPNPLGGERVEGPVAERASLPESLQPALRSCMA